MSAETVTVGRKPWLAPVALAFAAALLAGPLAAEGTWLTLLGAMTVALVIVVVLRPELAVYLFLAISPLVAGIDRGRLIPILRPNEAVLLLLGGALCIRVALRFMRGAPLRVVVDRMDAALIAMVVTSSIVPLAWLVIRGQGISGDDVVYALTLWKYYGLYLMVRYCIRSREQVSTSLWVALAATAVVAVVAILQSLQLFGVPELLARYHAPFGDEISLAGFRGTSTLASSHAVADVTTFALAITLAWLAFGNHRRLLLWACAALFTLGTLASGQISGVIGLLVGLVVTGILTRRGSRLALPGLLFSAVAALALRPVVSTRLSDFSATGGHIPQSWVVRWQNLVTYFWPELSSNFNYLLGVRPSARVPSPDPVNQWVWIESGHTWLLWTGGIPFFLAFLFFLVVAIRRTARVARSRHDSIGVAAVGGCVALAVVAVLMTFDVHLTLRGTADLLFPLLALAGAGERGALPAIWRPLTAPAGTSARPARNPRPRNPIGVSSLPRTDTGGGLLNPPLERAPRATTSATPFLDDLDALAAGPLGDASRLYRVGKRILDLALASFLVLLAAPLMALIALLVKATSPGPVLFRQERIGQRGRPFVLFKFRTMYADADDAIHRAYVTRLLTEESPPDGGRPGLYKLHADPRVTPIGAWLRRTSLDELPQLLNVLRGEMSLVGPRPGLDWEVELYRPHQRARLLVKPGLAGLPQVYGRNHLSMRESLDLDVEYVRRRSFSSDLVILAKMLPAVLSARGAR